MFHRIRFDTKEGKTHVFLDDQEVQGCINASFTYDVNCIPVVQLTLKAVNIEVDADTADICKISDDPIETLNLTARTIDILRRGIWYTDMHERNVDRVFTVSKLLFEFNAGRIMKYKGIGPSRAAAIAKALQERGLV